MPAPTAASDESVSPKRRRSQTPTPITTADAVAPNVTRRPGPIQPRLTARTKKNATPSAMTTPPAQASAFAPRTSLISNDGSECSGGGLNDGGGSAGGAWVSWCGGGRHPVGTPCVTRVRGGAGRVAVADAASAFKASRSRSISRTRRSSSSIRSRTACSVIALRLLRGIAVVLCIARLLYKSRVSCEARGVRPSRRRGRGRA
jgi:hypothetical protein